MGAKLDKNSENAKDSALKVTIALRKKNKYRWFGYHLASMLYYQNPDSSLRTRYQNSFHCCEKLYQGNGRITAKYCKNRWCPQCQRIRMGTLINAYAPRLQDEKELYFITLTRPNVRAEQLPEEIATYNKKWQLIKSSKWFRRATVLENMIGIKKLECTYHANRYVLKKLPPEWKQEHGKWYKVQRFERTSEKDEWYDTYHPHFHILVNNKEAALKIIEKWLKINPESSPAAQNYQEVTNKKAYLEIFKYFTKLVAKDSNGKRFFDAKHMNVIFEAMSGRQVYKRIGSDESWKCGEVNEEETEEEAAIFLQDMSWKTFSWKEIEDKFGYYDVDSGEILTEMVAPDHLMEIINHEKMKGKELELFNKKSTLG